MTEYMWINCKPKWFVRCEELFLFVKCERRNDPSRRVCPQQASPNGARLSAMNRQKVTSRYLYSCCIHEASFLRSADIKRSSHAEDFTLV